MKKILIDGNVIETREELFCSLKEQMGSETFVGNNLDALYDVLKEHGEPVELEIRNMGGLRDSLGNYVERLVRVFFEYQREMEMYGK